MIENFRRSPKPAVLNKQSPLGVAVVLNQTQFQV